jgi:hypothetical protein
MTERDATPAVARPSAGGPRRRGGARGSSLGASASLAGGARPGVPEVVRESSTSRTAPNQRNPSIFRTHANQTASGALGGMIAKRTRRSRAPGQLRSLPADDPHYVLQERMARRCRTNPNHRAWCFDAWRPRASLGCAETNEPTKTTNINGLADYRTENEPEPARSWLRSGPASAMALPLRRGRRRPGVAAPRARRRARSSCQGSLWACG